MTEQTESDVFERVTRWVGDLDHPYYEDERNRFVWYEAQAVGFQMLFLGAYVVAGVMMWIGKREALPYALSLLGLAVLTSLVVKTMTARGKAEYWPGASDFTRPRGRVVVAVGTFLAFGVVYAMTEPATADSGGAVIGGLGVIFGLALAVFAAVLKRRSAAKAELDRPIEE